MEAEAFAAEEEVLASVGKGASSCVLSLSMTSQNSRRVGNLLGGKERGRVGMRGGRPELKGRGLRLGHTRTWSAFCWLGNGLLC